MGHFTENLIHDIKERRQSLLDEAVILEETLQILQPKDEVTEDPQTKAEVIDIRPKTRAKRKRERKAKRHSVQRLILDKLEDDGPSPKQSFYGLSLRSSINRAFQALIVKGLIAIDEDEEQTVSAVEQHAAV